MDFYFAEYVWLDGEGNFRSKTRVISNESKNRFNIKYYPIWNFDGSSTGDAHIDNSEVKLEPYVVYPDVFRDFNIDVIVFCMIFTENKKISSRYNAIDIFNKYGYLEPMFGLEQEFFMLDGNTKLPLNYNNDNIKNTYYCGVGTGNVSKVMRTFMNQAMLMMARAGILLTGMNMEVSPGQGEFQVCNIGIDACDQLIFMRYILVRLSEDFNIIIDFSPKLLNNLNGSGCHINFSTKLMRQDNGYEHIEQALQKLKNTKDTHLFWYGKDNEKRLTGNCETSKYSEFTIGRGNRGSSIRIPVKTLEDNRGYFEDRRPGANMDPYLACIFLLTSIL
jgi:glutamine synthetase